MNDEHDNLDLPNADPQLGGDDFGVADIQSPLPISDGFVDRTLQRVLADRAAIDAEASRVDDVQFPEGLLDAYDAPSISADFVDRVTVATIAAKQEAQADWSALLATYGPPGESVDFVERTLNALRIERSKLKLVPSQEKTEAPRIAALLGGAATTSPSRRSSSGQRAGRGWRLVASAAAAAALIVSLILALRGPWRESASAGGGPDNPVVAEAPVKDAPPKRLDATNYSATAWSTAFAASNATGGADFSPTVAFAAWGESR